MRCVLLLICCTAIGCGSNSPYKYVKVKGKIAYEDGSPIPGGGLRLRFEALDTPEVKDAFPRPAYANVNAQGEFDLVTSYKYGDGLIPGRHKVAIEVGSGMDERAPVPREYQSLSTTPLIVDTADSPFDIKIPKPDVQQRR